MVTPSPLSGLRLSVAVAKFTSKAYLVPENVTPSELDCVTFFYPDDPLYKQQLVAAYLYFGQWTAWERGRGNIASQAASAWKEAIQLSMEQNFMANVTVNNNIENGGCCSCGGGNSNLTDFTFNITVDANTKLESDPTGDNTIFSEDEGGPNPPEQFQDQASTWEEYNEQKCRAANYHAGEILEGLETFRYIFDNFIELSATSILTRIAAIAADGPWPVIDTAVALTFLVPRLQDWIADKAGDTSDISAFLLTMDKCEITQLIYDASTKDGLFTTMQAYFVDLIDNSNMGDTSKAWFGTLMRMAFGASWADWLLDGLYDLVPESVVIECDCTNEDGQRIWNFNDGTLQGWIFQATQPYPTSNNTGGIVTDALEGSHAIDLNMPFILGNGQLDTSQWSHTITIPRPLMAEGDKLRLTYQYDGNHEHYIQVFLDIFGGGTESIVTSTFPAGGGSGTLDFVIPVGGETGSLDRIRIRGFAVGIGDGSNSGRYRFDNIQLFVADEA